MKRIFALLLAMVLFLSCISCQKEESTGAEVSGTTEETSETTTEVPSTTEAPTTTTVAPTSKEFVDPESQTSFENYDNIFVVTGAANLNVREEPKSTGRILGAIPEFGGGTILKESDDKEWYYVQSGAITGYVSGLYVVTGSAATQFAQEKIATRIKITEPTVNIREAASVEAKAFAQTYAGNVFDFLGVADGFYQIQFNAEKVGYIHESCVNEGLYLKEAYQVDSPNEETAESSETNSLSLNQPTETTTTVAPTTEPPTTTVAPTTVGYKAPEGQITVCIDAGHKYGGGDSEKEPIGPGATEMKAKLTSGAQGVVTRVEEHVINLEVALKLKTILIDRGYNVVMIRENGDCTLSNAQRAQVANQAGADAFVRIHCNSSSDGAVTGICTYSPSGSNPYMSAALSQKSYELANCVVDQMCAKTGARNLGIVTNDSMTGINWAQMPVTIIEMGFLSNVDEDQKLSDNTYQALLAYGIADGINEFFGR